MEYLVVHPQFSNIGGAEKVALFFIQILTQKLKTKVTVLSTTSFDTDLIEHQSGIKIDPEMISEKRLVLPSFIERNFFHTRIALLHRHAKRISPQFDYLISTYNELDFGKFSLQYIHHPMLASDNYLITNKLALKKKFPFNFTSPLYRYINDIIANRNLNNISLNYSLSNSIFINNIFNSIYNKKTVVVYPSVIGKNPEFFFNKSKRQLLTISRFSPNKNVSSLFQLFTKLHKIHPEFEFVIAGLIEDMSYFHRIKKEADIQPFSVQLYPNCSREQIVELYKQSEYYINPKEYEHFGIAVLEAAKHGCIPIVHASGGSIEIVPIKDLHFKDIHEVTSLIHKIEVSNKLKTQIKKDLKTHISMFSEKKFQIEIFEAINSYIKKVNKTL